MEQAKRDTYHFADVEVDSLRGCVRRNGKELERPVRLSQHDLDVFVHLIENRHRLVTKEELLDTFWKETQVTPDSLVQCVKKIRRAIGDDWRNPRYVETVPKGGYRFIGQIEQARGVTIATEESASLKIEVSPWLTRRMFVGAILCLAVVTAISLYGYFRPRSTLAGQRMVATTLPNVSGKKVLAVLYFENLSGDPDLDWLGAGLADMFITDFSRSSQLTAISREQLHALLERKDRKPLSRIPFEMGLEVAREGRADAVVLGSFARFGEKLRIDVRLHDAQTGQSLQAASLNIDKLDQIPAQIDLLTLRLANQLGTATNAIERGQGLSQVMTNNLEAYRYYSLALEKAESLHNQDAVSLLEKAIALDPQFVMAYARIGYVLAVRASLVDQAKPYLEKAFQLSARLGDKDKLLIAAWYQIANADFPQAVATYQNITHAYPLEVEAYLRLGHLLAGEGHSAEAIDVLKQGLAIDPEAKDLYNELGSLYSSRSQHDEAIAMHRHYVELAPGEANAHDSLGMSLQWAGRYSEAIAEYNTALGLSKNFQIAVVHLANAYFQTGRYSLALPLYREYIRIAPSNAERARGFASIGNIHLNRGELLQARQAAKMETRQEPTYIGTAILLALKQGRTDLAERIKRSKAMTQNRGARSTNRSSHYFDGLIALKKGDGEHAVQKFKEALSSAPTIWNIDPWEDCVARAYLELGNFAAAIEEFKRVLSSHPNYPLANYYLAMAFERNGMRDKAFSEYQQFLQVWKDADPDLPEVVKAREFISQN